MDREQAANDFDVLKSDCHLPNKLVLSTSIEAFKNDEKCILFHVKSSFRVQDI